MINKKTVIKEAEIKSSRLTGDLQTSLLSALKEIVKSLRSRPRPITLHLLERSMLQLLLPRVWNSVVKRKTIHQSRWRTLLHQLLKGHFKRILSIAIFLYQAQPTHHVNKPLHLTNLQHLTSNLFSNRASHQFHTLRSNVKQAKSKSFKLKTVSYFLSLSFSGCSCCPSCSKGRWSKTSQTCPCWRRFKIQAQV